MPKNQVVQKNGHMVEIVGYQPIYKRVGDSAAQEKLMKVKADVLASRSNRTGRGDVYKPLWNKDGSLKEGCAPYQKISRSGRGDPRCVIKRHHEKTTDPYTGRVTVSKKVKPLSADVNAQRKVAEQYYLTNGLSRKAQYAKAMRDITEAKDYLASDGYGHSINKNKNVPGDKDQAWDESRKRWIVQKDKRCAFKDITNCPDGTFPPGTRGDYEYVPAQKTSRTRKYRRQA
jgi:hypothetical protein